MFKWAFQRSQKTLAKEKEQAEETPKRQQAFSFQSFPPRMPERPKFYRISERFEFEDGRSYDSGSISDPYIEECMKGYNECITLPNDVYQWYESHGFIGWRACAALYQHWLVHNACTIPPEDALRHGWQLKNIGGNAIESKENEAIIEVDKAYNVKGLLKKYAVKCNIFGFCIAIFNVNSDDPQYYQKPFNIDAVADGNYTGITIVEPYWCSPGISSINTRDASNPQFYEPEFWVIHNTLYHHTHLMIVRCSEVPDILKFRYNYGGISLVQRIYERVYAAERTANEAPILAQSKRLFVYKTEMQEALLHQEDLHNKAKMLREFSDNFSLLLADNSEDVQKLETSLTDVDDLIANQYNLVAAVAGIPITKLLCTSPKGLNSTGEGEMFNYHEKLESIQSDWFDPFLDKHYQLLLKSLNLDFKVQIAWNPTDSITAEKQAMINNTNAQMLANLIASGVVSQAEARMFLEDQKKSGFNRFEETEETDEDATLGKLYNLVGQENENSKANDV